MWTCTQETRLLEVWRHSVSTGSVVRAQHFPMMQMCLNFTNNQMFCRLNRLFCGYGEINILELVNTAVLIIGLMVWWPNNNVCCILCASQQVHSWIAFHFLQAAAVRRLLMWMKKEAAAASSERRSNCFIIISDSVDMKKATNLKHSNYVVKCMNPQW